jgi:hypothetical protein
MHRAERHDWPIRIFRLGEEPGDDLSGCTTAAQRLAMVEELSARAWALTGWPVPSLARHELPIVVRRLR